MSDFIPSPPLPYAKNVDLFRFGKTPEQVKLEWQRAQLKLALDEMAALINLHCRYKNDNDSMYEDCQETLIKHGYLPKKEPK